MTHGPGHCRLRPAPANERRSTSRPGFGCPPQRADLTFPGDTPRIPPRPRDHEPGLPNGNGPRRRAQGDERPACPAHRRTRPRACVSRLRAAAQSLEKRLNRRLDTPPVRPEPLGRGGGGPQRQAALRHATRIGSSPRRATPSWWSTAVAAALLPPDLRVRTSLYAAGPVVDGVLRGRPGALRPRRSHASADAATPRTRWREGACDRDPFARLRVLADALKARGIRAGAGRPRGRRELVRAGVGAPGLGAVRSQLVVRRAGLRARLQRQQRRLHLAAGHPRRALPPASRMWPDLGDVAVREPDGHGAGRRSVPTSATASSGYPGTAQRLGRRARSRWTARRAPSHSR